MKKYIVIVRAIEFFIRTLHRYLIEETIHNSPKKFSLNINFSKKKIKSNSYIKNLDNYKS